MYLSYHKEIKNARQMPLLKFACTHQICYQHNFELYNDNPMLA
jgi:hypothetical protein